MTSPESIWKRWDVAAFLDRISSGLSAFRLSYHGVTAEGNYEWKVQLFPGYCCYFQIFPERSSSGSASFTAGLTIRSSRQAEVERDLAISTCYGDLIQAELDDADVDILYVSFHWLVMRWEPRMGGDGAAFSRWRDVPTVRALDCAEDVVEVFGEQGVAFLRMFSSPLELARVLQDLNGFPGHLEGGGAVSSDPLEFSAVLFCDCGLYEEARSALRRNLEITQEKVRIGTWFSDVLRVNRCKSSRLSDWIDRSARLGS